MPLIDRETDTTHYFYQMYFFFLTVGMPKMPCEWVPMGNRASGTQIQNISCISYMVPALPTTYVFIEK